MGDASGGGERPRRCCTSGRDPRGGHADQRFVGARMTRHGYGMPPTGPEIDGVDVGTRR